LAALQGRPVPAEDEQTREVYFIYPENLHQRAMRALEEQEDLAAIRRGIEDMEAGRLIPLEEADAQIRQELGFPPRNA